MTALRGLRSSASPTASTASANSRRSGFRRGLFEFVDRGSDDELAIINNRAAFDRVKFRPRALVDVSARSSETAVLGQTIGMPLAVAPTGAAGLVWYKGEMALARAAAAAKVPFTLATRSMSAMEDIASEAGGMLWLQLYTSARPGRTATTIIERARKAKFQGLVLTVDTPTNPSRDYNERNGYSLPFKYTVRGVTDILRHPRWFAGVIGRYLTRRRPAAVREPARPAHHRRRHVADADAERRSHLGATSRNTASAGPAS